MFRAQQNAFDDAVGMSYLCSGQLCLLRGLLVWSLAELRLGVWFLTPFGSDY
jgi:hypothetical protein